MIWGPFVLAVALGLMVSAGLYVAYLWPEPPADEAGPTAEGTAPPTSTAAEPPPA